ncbi:MAG: Spy/CpxP family protein refolding chaperone [Sterolibacterium sp.]|jgi:Spy/CpxP family protein refolding chaperone|nr:Spy/CpxP family protein refolding chaperone [Sterolibacterium sp.]
MKRVQKIVLGIAAFTAIGLSAETVWAEPGGWGMMGAGPEACPHEKGMMRGKMSGKAGQADFAAAATARLDKLKTTLKITAAQETAWQAFAGKAKQQIESMQTMRAPSPSQPAAANTPALSAPERMDKGIEFMKQRLTNMEAMNTALKDLYAVLTPEQKAVADQHFSHHPEQRRGRMMRRGAASGAPAAQ